MKFTSPRKVVLAAMGHVVAFEKGDTHNLPVALHQVALEQGLEPAEAITREQKPDDSERIEAIKTAMQQIAVRNARDDFDAGGIPKVRAIEALASQSAAEAGQTAALTRIAEGQDRLIEALSAAETGTHIDAESRMRLRSIDVQLLRILEEISAGRQETLSDLRHDMATLTQAVRQQTRPREG